MPTFSWTIPSAGTGPSGPSSGASTAVAMFGFFDQEIDPSSRDYIDADDGSWSETEDSRAAVMLQLSIRYGEWFADPEAGTRLFAMIETGEPISNQQVLDEIKRCLQLLVEDGIISDLGVSVSDEDEVRGYLELEITYTDRASGHVVDFSYSPFDVELAA